MYDGKATCKASQSQGKCERISRYIQHRKYNVSGSQSYSKETQKKKRRAQYLIFNRELYDELKNGIHSLTINKELRKLNRIQIE